MSKIFYLITSKTFPIFFLLAIYGVCCGHHFENQRSRQYFVKSVVCKFYSICLVLYMSIISHFVTSNKFYLDNSAENAVDWSLRISLWVIIPSHLRNGQKYRTVITKIMQKNVTFDDLKLRNDLIFIVFYLCLITGDIIAWFIFYYDTNFYLTMYEYIRSKYESRIHTLTYIKFGFLVRILETALEKFNEELSQQAAEVRHFKDNDCEEIVQKFVKLRKVYNDLMEHARTVSDIIGVPVLVILTVGISCLATLLYSLLFSPPDEEEVNNKYNIFFYVVANVSSVAYFMNICTRLVIEYEKSGRIIQELGFLCDNDKVLNEIRVLSFQHHMADLKLSVCGYFSMDNSILFKYLTLLASNLIIINQLKEQDLLDDI